MATRYRIFAYSPTHNQKQQQHDLMDNALLADPAYAQQVAESYANGLNSNFFLHVCDWKPSIEAYEHIPN